MIKAIVFDFDGTLIDSTDSIWREYQRVSKIMGLRRITFREFASHLGRPWEKVLESIWPGVDVWEFSRIYRQDREKTTLLANVTETLEELNKNYVLALLTSRGRRTLYKHLDSVGMKKELFKLIFYKESLKEHKPDPRALQHACEKLNLKPSEVIYVGDSIVDAECSLSAGIRFVGVLTGGTERSDFTKIGVKHVIDSMEELPELVYSMP